MQTYSPYAYDGAMAMMKAMTQANSAEPDKYLPILAATSMAGVTSRQIAYDSRGDLKEGGITIYKVVSGKWQPVESLAGR
ncbi:hypothetical protein D3C72_2518740 [compost metagenome]